MRESVRPDARSARDRLTTRHATHRRIEPWQLATITAVAVGVGFSVLLMSVSAGVSFDIHQRLANPMLRTNRLVDVETVDNILTILTLVVTSAMLVQTAAVTFIVGVTVMRSRREEIAIRRQSGVLRSRLVYEFLRAMLTTCLLGGIFGEVLGIVAASLLAELTVLPARFTAISVFASFPITVGLALLATLIPAWGAANASPALLRRE
jgi:ABC-type antimicrobial peptide transport system permease subunit